MSRNRYNFNSRTLPKEAQVKLTLFGVDENYVSKLLVVLMPHK